MPDPAAMFFQRLAAWLTAPPPSSRLGARGEREAGKFLRKQGLRILERNWRCRGGEIDLVCMEGSVLVFVEVKTRRGEHARAAVVGGVDAVERVVLTTHSLQANLHGHIGGSFRSRCPGTPRALLRALLRGKASLDPVRHAGKANHPRRPDCDRHFR